MNYPFYLPIKAILELENYKYYSEIEIRHFINECRVDCYMRGGRLFVNVEELTQKLPLLQIKLSNDYQKTRNKQRFAQYKQNVFNTATCVTVRFFLISEAKVTQKIKNMNYIIAFLSNIFYFLVLQKEMKAKKDAIDCLTKAIQLKEQKNFNSLGGEDINTLDYQQTKLQRLQAEYSDFEVEIQKKVHFNNNNVDFFLNQQHILALNRKEEQIEGFALLLKNVQEAPNTYDNLPENWLSNLLKEIDTPTSQVSQESEESNDDTKTLLYKLDKLFDDFIKNNRKE